MAKKELASWIIESINAEKTFWEETYPEMTIDDKVTFWSNSLGRQMRWQVESGLDPYIIYSKEWLIKTQKREPNIKFFIDKINTKYWKGIWDVDEINKKLE